MIEAIAHLIHRDYENIGNDFVNLDFIPKGYNNNNDNNKIIFYYNNNNRSRYRTYYTCTSKSF